MPKYNVIFCGTPEFACTALRALHEDPDFDVSLVITQPDKPAGRGKKLTASPVKQCAVSLGIPVAQPGDINGYQLPQHHRGCGAAPVTGYQFLVLVAYGQILGRELLGLPTIAPVNLHPSLLPLLRGATPIQHSILMGHTETGVTIQRMAKEVDSGPILAQEKVTIDPRETAVSLSEKLARLGARLLVQTLKQPLKETSQNDDAATYCGKLGRETGEVDPEKMTAEEIDRRVRALNPWPGVRLHTRFMFQASGFRNARRTESNHGGSGEIKLIETSLKPHPDAIEIPCANGTPLFIVKLQSPGKRAMTGREWERGRQ